MELRACAMAGLLALCVYAQVPLDPGQFPDLVARLDKTDAAERSVPCQVHALHPRLSFDFRFQAGYYLFVPLKAFRGAGNGFTVLTRITPQDSIPKPAYFTQTVDLPEIPRKTRSDVQLAGGYFLGEGRYNVDLMLLDQTDRVCRKHWRVEVKRSGSDREVQVAIAHGNVAPFTFESWKSMLDERRGSASRPLRLTILLHTAPIFRRSSTLRTYDQEMLLTSLASLMEQLPYTQVKLVAFNLDQQSEIFRQDNFDSANWDRLLEAMEKLQLGTVSYNVLTRRAGHVDLLNKLVEEELAGDSRSDAVIFLGPTARQSDKPPVLPQRAEGAPQPLFFYFEYKPYWFRGAEFPDVLYHMTRALAGKVFRIHSPSEFASAIKVVQAALEERPAQSGE